MAIQGDFQVEVCNWSKPADREALLAVREDVFVRGQHVPVELERDYADAACFHVLARALDGTPIATGRMTPDGVIGRMAVLHDWRGHGIGTLVLRTLLDVARSRGLGSVSLHAQRTAVPFYQKHGFTIEGEEFEEAGIAHVNMQRGITPLAAPARPAPAVAPQPLVLHSDTREELIAITHALLSGARHTMCVWIRELHPVLLNDTACLVELRRLAISGRGASIRIIVQDLTRALEEGSRLLELAQRLSSVIELRRPVEPADLAYRSAFMCVDTCGYLFRPLEHEMVAQGSTWAPGRHAQLKRLFEDAWIRATPWSELRVLGI